MTSEERDELNALEAAELAEDLTPWERDEISRVMADVPSLRDFVRLAWPVVEPSTTYLSNWHIDAICDHLTYVTAGEIRRLVINIPFRCMKSLAVSVLWPAWEWAFRPGTRWLFASYAQSLSIRDTVKMRRLITSPWYQARWGHRFKLAWDQNQKIKFENDQGGHRIATSTGGSTIGEGGDKLVIDDAHNREEIYSDLMREGVIEWWRETWSGRKNDPENSAEVIIGQRLHERDLPGWLLDERGGFEHLCLPMRYEPDRHCVTSIGWEDPREKDGELMWPHRFTEKAVAQSEKDLGEYGASGQLQQRPAPAGGGIFKIHWWRFWYPAGIQAPAPELAKLPDGTWFECPQVQLPEKFEGQFQSWDMSFKSITSKRATKSSSFVAGQAWAKQKADAFLMDQVRDKWGLPDTCAQVRAFSTKWPETRNKWVENKANGPDVIETLQHEVAGLLGVTLDGDKLARAHAASPFVQSGNVYLPHPKVFSWVRALLKELTEFPNAANDDQVDALTQAVIQMFTKFRGEAKMLKVSGA